MKQRFIVAEVSKNWERLADGTVDLPKTSRDMICGMFEDLIEVNRQRGYRLHSWHLHRTMAGTNWLNETIVAVFELKD